MRTVNFNGITYTITDVPAQYGQVLKTFLNIHAGLDNPYSTVHGAKYVSRIDLDKYFAQAVRGSQQLDNDTADIYNAQRTELYSVHAELLKVLKAMFDDNKRPVATIDGVEYGIGFTTKNGISNITFRTRESFVPASSDEPASL